MLRFALAAACALPLAACGPTAQVTRDAGPEVSCLTRPGCSFNGAPLYVIPQAVRIEGRPYEFFPTAEPLEFTDARGARWLAPQRTLTDGASVPQIFTGIVGAPTSPQFVNAAAMHDAYCGIGNEDGPKYHSAPWEDVHRMFYNGLITGGARPVIARIMFAAVWLGGPRWDVPGTPARLSTKGTEGEPYDGARSLDRVPVWRLQQAMRRAKRFIETEDPNLPELIAFLRAEETRMLEEYPEHPVIPEGSYGSDADHEGVEIPEGDFGEPALGADGGPTAL